MTRTEGQPCPHCRFPVGALDQFCESCGTALGPAAASVPDAVPASVPADDGDPETGLDPARTRLLQPAPLAAEPVPPAVRRCAECDGEIDADGYCTQCGSKAAAERDHWVETPAPWVAAVCDKGRRHYRNEDAVATAADPEPASFCALVVCDGVSSSTDSDRASLDAARAARDVLVAAHRPEEHDDEIGYWTERLGEAAHAANDKASEVAAASQDGGNPPSCTFVAAVLRGQLLVAGSVGDSRAYWLPDDGAAAQLTVDDSWATEAVRGGMPRAEAEADARAHGITRWLGIDAPDATPACVATTTDGAPGWLVVCSDGLWNYKSEAADLRALVAELSTDSDDPVKLAGALVDWANAQGGADNISAIVARVPAVTTATRSKHG